jgi:hypothetical protein
VTWTVQPVQHDSQLLGVRTMQDSSAAAAVRCYTVGMGLNFRPHVTSVGSARKWVYLTCNSIPKRTYTGYGYFMGICHRRHQSASGANAESWWSRI